MADLDRLLSEGRGGVARSAEEAAVVPDFAAVVRRGRMRRTRRQAAVLGAAALAVAGIVASVQLLAPGRSEPSPAPAPTAPTDPTDPADPTDAGRARSQAELSGLVDAPDAGLVRLATTPGAVEQRATLWQVADGETWVLALTDDDYAHRRLVEVPVGSDVAPAGDGRFVLRESWEGRRLAVLDVEGEATTVAVGPDPAPLAGDEVPVVLSDDGAVRLVAVTPDGRAHPVPTPHDAVQVVAYAHRITALSSAPGGSAYHWSDDGGASWQQLELGDGFLPEVARSAIGQSHAVLEGGDGATLFPLMAVRTASAADPGAWARVTVERGERWPTVTGSWVDRDGRLRVLASIWEEGSERPVDVGVWLVEGGRLEKVPSDHPDAESLAAAGIIHQEYVDGPVIWVAGADADVWRTADDGSTWERFAAR